MLHFQFTTSHGGRPYIQFRFRPLHVLSIHDLTRRSTYYILFLCTIFILSIHDLTRRSTKTFFNPFQYVTFQFTTSHGGRLNNVVIICIKSNLSIHDLTRRSTFIVVFTHLTCTLSIHDLTRRSTSLRVLSYIRLTLSIHDLTRRSTKRARDR